MFRSERTWTRQGPRDHDLQKFSQLTLRHGDELLCCHGHRVAGTKRRAKFLIVLSSLSF